MKLGCAIFVLLLLTGAFLFVPAGTAVAAQDGDYVYEVVGNPAVANISGYEGEGGAIVIPSTLGGYTTAAIDDDAFAWQETLTSVVIPSSVKTIGYSSFYNCISLTSVTLGSGVTTIGYGAFYSCSILTSITFQGLFAPTSVGADWIAYTDPGLLGHAYTASNFPTPGGIWNGLTMGELLPAPVAPGSPTGLAATGGTGFVLLNWTAPSEVGEPPLARYDVYRGTSSGDYGGPIGNVSAGIMTSMDTTAIPGIPYFYVVKAVNWVGPSPASNQATGTALPTVPSAPHNVEASAGAGNMSLSWEAPASNGGSSITNYKIYRSTSSGGETLLATIGNALGFTDHGLTNGQLYYYQVSAVNDLGEGARSEEVTATPASVPTAPRGLQALAGDSIVALNWTAPEYAGPGTLTYHLFRGSSEIWTGTASAHDDVSVTNGITYSYQVAASNSLGWGEKCSAVLATPFGPPSAPRGLTTVPGNELIDLNWTAPVYLGPGTTIYHLFRDGAEIWNGTAVAHGDAPLTKGVEHYYTVAANNSIGWGQNSSVVRSAALGVPDAPRDLAAAAGDGWIALDWAAPSYVGPGTLTYHLLRNASEIWRGVATHYTDLAVVNGVNYSYSAVANNSIGWGASSAEVQATPQAGDTVPTWPRDLTAMPGDQHVDLNWTEPSYLGPGTITYHLFRDSIEIWSGTETAFQDSPLDKGVEYSFTVAAQNSIGWGPNCTAVLATPFGVPDAPWNLSAIAGDGQVSLSWNAVNYSGPGTLLYHLFRDDILIWSGSEAIFTDTDVANGFSYAYNVAASNSVGWSENSSIAFAAPIGPPSEPIGLAATAGDEQVDLTWDAPVYWGPGGITYHLFRDDVQIWSGGVNYYNDSSLTNGMTYNYTVSASNSIGWGLNSTEVPASPFGPPSAPLNLVAVPGHDNMTLNWTAPVYAGPGILTYHLFRDDAMVWSGSEITHIDTGLTGGRNYSYRVSASNSVGWGSNSTLVEVAPIALVLPSMPENFQVTASDGSVNISWGAPLASGTSPITGYKIYRGTNASSMTLLTTVTSGAIYQDTSVTNGQKYYYKVCASSSVGDGVATEVLNATPQAPIAPASPGDSTMIFVAIGVVVIGLVLALLGRGRKKSDQ